MHAGEYEFTIDTAHPDKSVIDTNFSELDPEHKSFNVIALDNGQFAAQPNNRVVWRDNSLIPVVLNNLISKFALKTMLLKLNQNGGQLDTQMSGNTKP